MNEIFNENNIRLENCDCMNRLRGMPDNCFNLAIVDPPYGIGEDGGKNHTRGKLAISQDYKPYRSTDNAPPPMRISSANYLGLARIRLCGVQITLSAKCRMTVVVG